jgi:hypothetical protein
MQCGILGDLDIETEDQRQSAVPEYLKNDSTESWDEGLQITMVSSL